MRDYQRKKQTKYKLPRTVYHQTIWRIRDYDRVKQLADDLLGLKSFNNDGMPKGNGTSDTVASVVSKRYELLKDVDVIDKALNIIPEEYREGIWDNIQHNKSYPMDAGRATYGRYKSKFVYLVAEGLGLI